MPNKIRVNPIPSRMLYPVWTKWVERYVMITTMISDFPPRVVLYLALSQQKKEYLYFIDVSYEYVDELYATKDHPTPPSKSFPPIGIPPNLLKELTLYMKHYSLLASHPGGWKLYYKIREDFYWPAVAIDCNPIVRKFLRCALNGINFRKEVGKLQLFSAK